jgi:hypothetical protein
VGPAFLKYGYKVAAVERETQLSLQQRVAAGSFRHPVAVVFIIGRTLTARKPRKRVFKSALRIRRVDLLRTRPIGISTVKVRCMAEQILRERVATVPV